jgi:hypothetical protein
MADRAILEIDVQAQKFTAYQQQFVQSQRTLKQMPGALDQVIQRMRTLTAETKRFRAGGSFPACARSQPSCGRLA